MRRLLVVALVTASLLMTSLTPLVQIESARALYEQDIGKGDILVVLTPWETAVFYERLTRDTYPGPQCGIPGAGSVNRLWKRVNQVCNARRAVAYANYLRVKWFLYVAMKWGACGSFVVHHNELGEMTIRPAKAWDGDSYSTSTKIDYGESAYFEADRGYVGVTCDEYANPSLQSPLVNPTPQAPRREPPPHSGGDGTCCSGGDIG